MRNVFHAGLITKNSKVMEAFYRQLLGAQPSFEDGEYLEFNLGGIGVLDIESEGLLKQDLPDYQPGKFYLRFQVEDIDEVYDRCLENRVKVLKGPITQPYGKKELYILDPDDNLVQIFQEM